MSHFYNNLFMYRFYSLLILLFVSLFQFSATAKLKKLNISVDTNVFVSNENLYSHIILIDDRPEVEKKNLNIDEKAIAQVFNDMLPRKMSGKILAIQIVKLCLFKENGKNHFYIQARAYEQNQNKRWSFFWINTLNESFFNQYSDDEANAKICSILIDFIKVQLTQAPKSYSEENETSDFFNMPDIEKQEMYVYQTDLLVDGIYATYASFVEQNPDKEITKVKFKKENLKDVFYHNEGTEKDIKVKEKSIFGVVVDGSLFIQYNEGNRAKYIELFRDFDYNEFYFYTTKRSSSSFAVSFGLIGALLLPTNTKEEESRVVLDHLSGELKLAYKNVVKTRESIFGGKSEEEVVEGDGSLKKSW